MDVYHPIIKDVFKSNQIKSLGCVMVEMLTGEPPDYKLTEHEIHARVGKGKAPSYTLLQGASSAVHKFINRCLIVNYKKRPAPRKLLGDDFFQ